MAATATATATDSAPSAGAARPAVLPAIPEQYLHKNRLQELAQRMYNELPIYSIECEGELHEPKFKCTVEVGGQLFSPTQSFSRRKEAQQDAARVAYEALVTREKGGVKVLSELIDQDVVFGKSILNEFAVKMKTTFPSYSVACKQKPMTLFVGSVVFDGSTYTGEVATSKKEAEQKAANAAVKSILATGNRCMMEIIGSKEKLITAIKASRNIKYTRAVNQEVHNTPTKARSTFVPIKFTRPAAYTGEQGHVAPELQATVQDPKIVPAVDSSVNPSAKAATHLRKRKGRGSGLDVNEEGVSMEH